VRPASPRYRKDPTSNPWPSSICNPARLFRRQAHVTELGYQCAVRGIDRHVATETYDERMSFRNISTGTRSKEQKRFALPMLHSVPPAADGLIASAKRLPRGMAGSVEKLVGRHDRNGDRYPRRSSRRGHCTVRTFIPVPKKKGVAPMCHAIPSAVESAVLRPQAPRWRKWIGFSVTAWAKSCCRPHGYSGCSRGFPSRGRPRPSYRSTCYGYRTRACCCT
jgi:hypothetical protein